MYCKHCRYPLSHLRTPACPECGRQFDPADARTFCRSDRKPRLGVKGWLVLLLALYIGGYGAARWRKLLVRHDERVMSFRTDDNVYSVQAGFDHRKHGVGAIKNAIAQPVALLYLPLRGLEATLWNWHQSLLGGSPAPNVPPSCGCF